MRIGNKSGLVQTQAVVSIEQAWVHFHSCHASQEKIMGTEGQDLLHLAGKREWALGNRWRMVHLAGLDGTELAGRELVQIPA